MVVKNSVSKEIIIIFNHLLGIINNRLFSIIIL